MRKLLSALPIGVAAVFIWLAAATGMAQAQSNNVLIVATCGNQTFNVGTQYLGLATADPTGKLCVNATVSASVSGFTPGLTFATLTAAGTSGSVALPNGAVVAFQNTGTTTVSCTLGVGSATAVANEIQIPASSTVFVTVGSNTWGACIDQTGSASNLVVLAGGSGLGTGFGGGGGGGSGGTVTQGPAGASPWLVTGTGGTFPVTGTFWQATQPVSGTVTANQGGTWTVQGTGASGSALSGNPFRIALSDGTNAQNWLAAIALADGVNGNNTGAMASWLWNGATYDRQRGDLTNGAFVNVKTSVLPTGAATSALQGTNTATTVHTCSIVGYSELGCLGQIDDDIKGPISPGTNSIGNVGSDPSSGKGTPSSAALSLVVLATPTNSAFSTAATGGSLNSGTYFYRITATNGAGETLPSTETSQATAAQLATPVNSAFSTVTTGGTLAAGTYFYRVSAINAVGETLASTETSQVTTGTTSTVTVNWGAVTGATGYRVYGRTTGAELFIAAPGNVLTYTDTGSITPAGSLPASNTTANTSTVVVNWAAVTGATGYKIYGRSTGAELFIATVGAVTTYTDTGSITPAGALPAANTTAASTQIVAFSGTTSIYVTSFDFMMAGISNVSLVYGTGTNCGTGQNALTGLYPAIAQAGVAKGAGIGTVLKVPSGQALCALSSAGNIAGGGSVSYQQF